MKEFIREAMVGVNNKGKVILAGAGNGGIIEDTYQNWKLLLRERNNLTAIAHSHPGSGAPAPSGMDLSTFKSLSQAGFKHIDWWIATSTHLSLFTTEGKELLVLDLTRLLENREDGYLYIPGMGWVDDLMELSREGASFIEAVVKNINNPRR